MKEVKKAVKFFNWTDEDFSHKWDGEIYSFKAGETTMLPEGLALHFAKHAAVRELNKLGGPKALVNPQNMPPMVAKFLITSDVKADSEEKLKVALMNEKPVEEEKPKEDKPFCDSCDSKGGRHKKDCAVEAKEEVKAEAPSEEATFEGLKE